MDYKEIKKLMDDMGESKLSEIEIEFPDGIKISMKKDGEKNVKYSSPEVRILPKQQPERVKDTIEKNNTDGNIVKSPMVGTFYSKPSETSEPFVKKGSKIKKGDTLCIIEAMKLMNEIESEFEGEVIDILVRNGEIIEYGKPLFIVRSPIC